MVHSLHSLAMGSVEARWLALGTGRPTVFYGANGFPVGCYQPLLERLAATFEIDALELRACWAGAGGPDAGSDWSLYAADLIAFLEARARGPVVGVGHSLGAAAMIQAAVARPGLFRALLLIEPAMVDRHLTALARILPWSIMRRLEPVCGTLARPEKWSSETVFREQLSASPTYKRFTAEAVDVMVAASLRPAAEGGVERVFPRAWEAHNCACPPWVPGQLARLEVPVGVVWAKPSAFCGPGSWKRVSRMLPESHRIVLAEYGHLLPLEAPDACGAAVVQLAARLLPPSGVSQ